jgi:hypothetical protein
MRKFFTHSLGAMRRLATVLPHDVIARSRWPDSLTATEVQATSAGSRDYGLRPDTRSSR